MIHADPHWPLFIKGHGYEGLAEHGVCFKPHGRELPAPDDFYIGWGEKVHGVRGAAMESGFFWDGMHLDLHGLYENCSLNLAGARAEIEAYEAPVGWREMGVRSKHRQGADGMTWQGVVIVGQYHKDRSIKHAGSMRDYHGFIEQMCAHFGSRAFVKLHPVLTRDEEELARLREITTRYGSQMGHVGLSVLDECEFVVTYNSTFAVDAAMRGKHVFQYAPGYFWQTGLVQYCHRGLPPGSFERDAALVSKTLDFLLWRYCWHKALPLPRIAAMLEAFRTSHAMFPLPAEYSYGAFLTEGAGRKAAVGA